VSTLGTCSCFTKGIAMLEPPDSVRSLFTDAGWYPGRMIAVPSSVPSDHPAALVLGQFGGLKVGRCGRGEECATSDLAFQLLWPESDNSILGKWGELLGTLLVGVAIVHHSHGELYVDTFGRYFGLSCIHDAFYFEGATFPEAMERLLLGRRSLPMLRPDQQSITLYGICYTVDSPEVYRYR
jgi:hypothetical protein